MSGGAVKQKYLKIITEIRENHSEFSGCPIAAINFFQVNLDKLQNFPAMILL